MYRILASTYCFFLLLPLMGQKQIHGTVKGEDGRALMFATVSTTAGNGTVCDSLGKFVLDIPLNEAPPELLVSSLGYVTDTIMLAGNTTTIKAQLHKDMFSLNEVAVLVHRNIESKSAVSAFTTRKKEMVRLNPQNVCQVLQTKAGFTNKSGYQTPLTLRGLSGKRILVLRNGNRRFSSYPAGVMSHTINVYDLEKIEVEKGAASVIYGAGAMAGIINLVDKSPFKQKGFNAKVTTGYGSINNEKNFLSCGGWSNGKFAIKAGLRYREADDFKYPDGETAENSFYTDKDVFVTAGYQFSELQKLVFTADFHNGGPWGKPVGFNGSDYMRVQTQEEKSNNYSLKYSNAELGAFSNVELNAFYSDESRDLVKNYYAAAGYKLSYIETTHFSDYYYGASLKGEIEVSSKYRIVTGGDSYSFHISTPFDVIDYIESVSFGNRVSSNANSITSGIFMEHDISLNKQVKTQLGIRYNYASISEGDAFDTTQSSGRNETKDALSGNVSAMFRLTKHSKLKLNLARSFRMPETTELYTDNYTSNGIVYGNPNLEPEFCNSFDVSYRYHAKNFTIEASPFLWFMDDMITKEEIKGLPGTNYTYVNIGKTRMFGGELTAETRYKNVIKAKDNLLVRIGASYLNGTDITEMGGLFQEGTPLDYVPPFNVKSDVNYSCIFKEKVSFGMGLRGIYYAEQKRLGVSQFATPQYLVAGGNIGIGLPKLKVQPKLNITVNNLFNREYYSYLAYLPSEGRDIRMFLTLNF